MKFVELIAYCGTNRIGQKLSEKVASYHFTYAINAFRREVNVELTDETVKPWLRKDLGNVMVLPVSGIMGRSFTTLT